MNKNRFIHIIFLMLIGIVSIGCSLSSLVVFDEKSNNNMEETQDITVTQSPTTTDAVDVYPSAAIDNDIIKVATATNTPIYIPEPTRTPVPLEMLPESKCASLLMIEDVTIPDGYVLKPGEIFTKVWRIKNNGSCAWDAKHRIVFHKGAQLNGPDEAVAYFIAPSAHLDQEIGGWPDRMYSVEPSDTVDLALVLQAPMEEGIYSSFWLMANGFGEYIKTSFWTTIVVTGENDTEDNRWSGEWTIQDTYITIPVLVKGVIKQSDSKQVSGFFYNHQGEVNLIEGWITENEDTIEGYFGKPFSKSDGIPFRWKIFENNNQFSGVFWLGQLSANEICGSRYGYELPEPCLLE